MQNKKTSSFLLKERVLFSLMVIVLIILGLILLKGANESTVVDESTGTTEDFVSNSFSSEISSVNIGDGIPNKYRFFKESIFNGIYLAQFDIDTIKEAEGVTVIRPESNLKSYVEKYNINYSPQEKINQTDVTMLLNTFSSEIEMDPDNIVASSFDEPCKNSSNCQIASKVVNFEGYDNNQFSTYTDLLIDHENQSLCLVIHVTDKLIYDGSENRTRDEEKIIENTSCA